MARRPNIVLILADDHAAHAISAYGSVVNTTPRIDEIAHRGALLESCFCTNSICTPSRATILTGTYSHINGVLTLSTPIDALQPTFVSQLRDAGYKTAVVGKWHMGDGPGHNPEGFDYWDVLIDQGEYFDPDFLSKDGLRTVEGYATDLITDMSLGWAESLPDDQPWCLLIHHKAPHRSWEPDEAHAGMYKNIPVPATFNDDYSTRSTAARHAAMRVADELTQEDLKIDPPEGLTGEDLAIWKYQRYMEDYLAVVASVDDNVGRVIDWLESRGQFADTLLMYTSDQGFFLGDHGWFDKRFMYEESLRMPFVLSYPSAVEAGQRFEGIVSNVDIAQTILDAAGIPALERMQGRSFWNDITHEGEALPAAEGLYYRYWENDSHSHRVLAHYGYRDERYKIIYFYNDGLNVPGSGNATYPPEWELYDLHVDPDELCNAYYDASYADVRDVLQAKLWLAQSAVGDRPHHTQKVPRLIADGATLEQLPDAEPARP